jgi:hypothetical protein
MDTDGTSSTANTTAAMARPSRWRDAAMLAATATLALASPAVARAFMSVARGSAPSFGHCSSPPEIHLFRPMIKQGGHFTKRPRQKRRFRVVYVVNTPGEITVLTPYWRVGPKAVEHQGHFTSPPRGLPFHKRRIPLQLRFVSSYHQQAACRGLKIRVRK